VSANTMPEPPHQDPATPSTVQLWSGREARLLREAMRLSLRDFAAHLGINERVLSKWEAGGDTVHPRPGNQQVLDVALAKADASVQQRFERFVAQTEAPLPHASAVPPAGSRGELEARPSLLGSAVCLESGPTEQATAACRQVIRGAALDDEAPSGEALFAAAEAVRREVEDTLARGTISPTRLDRLEELVANHIRIYTTTAPAYALANLLVDFMDLQRLAAQRQPAMIQARLSELSALLATLAADSLMKLGQIPEASAWYGTAQMAADDSANAELRARVRAQHAMLPYYYGHAAEAARLAQDAQRILDGTPRAAGALAAAAEARALARLGNEPEARSAIALAQKLVDQNSVPGAHEPDDAFVFGPRRLLFYASTTMTNLGAAAEARRFQQQALENYSGRAGLIDPALIRLDQVQLLAAEGDFHGASELAGEVISSLPAAQRTLIFAARLRQIASAIPRRHEAFRAFKDMLCQLAHPDTRGT
jgi:DNA-binding transcriptional regulator YiaG/tetratricopeptide (TPR) repeat protein